MSHSGPSYCWISALPEDKEKSSQQINKKSWYTNYTEFSFQCPWKITGSCDVPKQSCERPFYFQRAQKRILEFHYKILQDVFVLSAKVCCRVVVAFFVFLSPRQNWGKMIQFDKHFSNRVESWNYQRLVVCILRFPHFNSYFFVWRNTCVVPVRLWWSWCCWWF